MGAINKPPDRPDVREFKRVTSDLASAIGDVLSPGVGSAVKLGILMLGWRGKKFLVRHHEATECLFRELHARLQSVESVEEKQQVAAEYLQDPVRAEAVEDGFEALLRAISDKAWPSIAALTADYWSAGKPIDTFFKEFGSYLTQCLAGDLEAGYALADLIAGEQERAPGDERVVVQYAPAVDPERRLFTLPQSPGTNARKVPTDARRTIRLLLQFGFATTTFGENHLAVSQEQSEDWRRIRDYLALGSPF